MKTLAALLLLFSLPLMQTQQPKSPDPSPPDKAKVKPTKKPGKKPAVVPQPVRLSRRPYKISVSVAFERTSAFPSHVRSLFLRDLELGLRRVMGRLWNLNVAENQWLVPAQTSTLDDLSIDDAMARFPTKQVERGYVLLIQRDGGSDRVTLREWHEGHRSLSEKVETSTADPRDLAAATAELIIDQFRPTFMLVSGDIRKTTMEIQAGSLAANDPSYQLVKPGDVIAPFFRYLTKEREVRRIQNITVTYLKVTQVAYGFAKCDMISGLSAGFSLGKARRRVEVRALTIPVRYPKTRLKLISQRPPIRPLAAHSIAVIGKTKIRDEHSSVVNLMSDRRGFVDIPSNRGRKLVWLYVNSGSMLVARIPYVPGFLPEETLELPDDTDRLTVEGRVEALRTELVDTVARRAVLIVKIKIFGDKADKDPKAKAEAIKLYQELREMTNDRGAGYFLNALSNYDQQVKQIPGGRFFKARAKASINDSTEKTRALVEKHLRDGKFDELREKYPFLAQSS